RPFTCIRSAPTIVRRGTRPSRSAMHHRAIDRVIDLTDPARNVLYNVSLDEARRRVASGDPAAVAGIDGQFALLAVQAQAVRTAGSISRPLRFFIAKLVDGPCLVASDRIDATHDWLEGQGWAGQFPPPSTRMVPAHPLTEVALVGCPDPSPVHRRFFDP